jgi:hypothetical protein
VLTTPLNVHEFIFFFCPVSQPHKMMFVSATTAMEAASQHETSAYFYETTRRSTTEGSHLHSQHREDLNSHSVNSNSNMSSTSKPISEMPKMSRCNSWHSCFPVFNLNPETRYRDKDISWFSSVPTSHKLGHVFPN